MELSDLQRVFEQQRNLTKRFIEIESQNLPGFYNSFYWDVNSPIHQAEIRLQASWIIEEYYEAFNAERGVKTVEELADALHFITELYIRARIPPEELNLSADRVRHADVSKALSYAVGSIYRMTRILANKPWKQTFQKVSTESFDAYARSIMLYFLDFCSTLGVEREKLVDAYFEKAEINYDRIHSGR